MHVDPQPPRKGIITVGRPVIYINPNLGTRLNTAYDLKSEDSPLRAHGCGGGAGGWSGRDGTLRLLGVQARRCDDARFCRLWMQASMIAQEGHRQPGETCWNHRKMERLRARTQGFFLKLKVVTEVGLNSWGIFTSLRM